MITQNSFPRLKMQPWYDPAYRNLNPLCHQAFEEKCNGAGKSHYLDLTTCFFLIVQSRPRSFPSGIEPWSWEPRTAYNRPLSA